MASSSGSPRPRLLVIEDEQEAAHFLSGYFRQFGLDVAVAFNAEEGASLMESFRPRLVLLDLRLGNGLDGLEVLEKFRPGETGPAVVVVTAVQDQNVADRATGLGACAYITKPFVLEELERVVLSRFKEKASPDQV